MNTAHAAPAVFVLSLIASLAAHARAEDAAQHGRLGLLFEISEGTRIGAQACVTQALCLRPSFSYEWIENDNAPILGQVELGGAVYKTTERYVGVGLDVVWRFHLAQPLSPYLGLGGTLSRSHVPYPDLVDDLIVIRHGPLTRTSVGALAGLECALSRHLALYGDVGLSLTDYDRFDIGGRRLHTRIWGSFSSGVGVAFSLK
jgi:hypothetical protein